MSQRHSGYERKPLDRYDTPAWVTDAMIWHMPRVPSFVWEPAAGGRKMVNALRRRCMDVHDTDITDKEPFDFMKAVTAADADAIITNPPFDLATKGKFIEHAIDLMEPNKGFVAMLLRADFDSASTRDHLFGASKIFAKKIVLTKRIVWFEPKIASPSFNHAWFVWDHQHRGRPTLAYAQ